MLKTIVEDGEIPIALHRVGMIEPELPLVDIQSLLLIDCCLQNQEKAISFQLEFCLVIVKI